MKKKYILLTAIAFCMMLIGLGGKTVYAEIPDKPNAYYYDKTGTLDDKTKSLVEQVSEGYQKNQKTASGGTGSH